MSLYIKINFIFWVKENISYCNSEYLIIIKSCFFGAFLYKGGQSEESRINRKIKSPG